MDAILSIVLLGSVYYSCKLILRFISHRSAILPQILFLEAEIARISEQTDDEQVFVIGLRERVTGLQGCLVRLQTRGPIAYSELSRAELPKTSRPRTVRAGAGDRS